MVIQHRSLPALGSDICLKSSLSLQSGAMVREHEPSCPQGVALLATADTFVPKFATALLVELT